MLYITSVIITDFLIQVFLPDHTGFGTGIWEGHLVFVDITNTILMRSNFIRLTEL